MFPYSFVAVPTSSFNKPVPIPAVEPNEGSQVTVQFSAAWLPYVLGALQQLLLQTTWDSQDKDTIISVQSSATDLIALIGNSINMPAILSIRVSPTNPCELQVTHDNVSWIDAADISECATQAINNYNSTVVNSGSTGGVFGQAPTVDASPSDALRCAVATALSTYVQKKCTASLTFIKSGVELGKALTEVAGDLIEAIPVFGALIKATLDMVSSVDVGHFDDLLAFNADPDQQQNWVFCKLYCLLGNDGILTEDIFNNWKQALELEPPQGGLATLIGQYQGLCIAALGFNAMRAEAFIHQHDSGTACDPCTDCTKGWCYKFDFTVNAYSDFWTVTQGAGEWEIGIGYRNNVSMTYPYTVDISIPITATVTEFKIGAYSENATANGTRGYYIVPAGAHEYGYKSSVGDYEMTFNAQVVASQKLELQVSNSGDTGTNAIRYVILSGTGANPFGSNNC